MKENPSSFLRIILLTLAISCSSNGSEDGAIFTHGIASGEVSEKAVVLWTRINQQHEVIAEISTDCTFKRVDEVILGEALAEDDFTVKLELNNLKPNNTYCYRFKAGEAVSEVGKFHTAPGNEQEPLVRFAYSSDSDGSKTPPFNDFEVLDRAREDHIDFWVYLGDTIYNDTFGPKAESLEEMRDKYKQNRDFQSLRNLLMDTSTYAIWDDHEVENDYDSETVDPTLYENGRKAFMEYMPIRESSFPDDPDCLGSPLFRIFHWGKTLDIIIIDERSCRSAEAVQVCEGDLLPTVPSEIRNLFSITQETPPGCVDAINEPNRTMLGNMQKEALKKSLLESNAVWKVIINEVPMSEFFVLPYDRWEGYPAEREEILTFISENDIKNLIILTGDLHINFIGDVRLNSFTSPMPIVKEIIAGPIAQNTFSSRLAEEVGSNDTASDLLSALVSLTQPLCLQGDAFGYALVETDSDSLDIELKDQNGLILMDQLNSSPCMLTIQAQ
ncbi:MAG: alkaline phosphatase D family protein [Thermodesulfobacteriota bacterium]